MPSPEQMIALLAPAAAEILAADADAIAKLMPRREELSLLDHQPAAAATANLRRAMVATAMRTTIAPRLGWALRGANLQSGAYEWELGGGVVARLSKTTRESRQNALLASVGVQSSFFEGPVPKGNDDVILVRLNGSVFGAPSVDAASLDSRGVVIYSYGMQTIATSTVDPITHSDVPRTPVQLPHEDERKHQSGDG